MLAVVMLQWFLQVRHSKSLVRNLASRTLGILLLKTVAQALIGVIQARLGVPPFLVALHMLGAAALASLITFQFLVLRQTK